MWPFSYNNGSLVTDFLLLILAAILTQPEGTGTLGLNLNYTNAGRDNFNYLNKLRSTLCSQYSAHETRLGLVLILEKAHC